MARWSRHYGAEAARAIALSNRAEPSLDLTVKADPQGWAARLGATLLPTGSVRLIPSGPIAQLAGYDEGAWWVQDAAAALAVRLFARLTDRRHGSSGCAKISRACRSTPKSSWRTRLSGRDEALTAF
jgi:16S rRNA (cytosine967-C5)-methyltransferase